MLLSLFVVFWGFSGSFLHVRASVSMDWLTIKLTGVSPRFHVIDRYRPRALRARCCNLIERTSLTDYVSFVSRKVSLTLYYTWCGNLSNPLKLLSWNVEMKVVGPIIGTLSNENGDGDGDRRLSGKMQIIICAWLAGKSLTFSVRPRRETSHFDVGWKREYSFSPSLLSKR